jgi:hypothetical protein
MGEVRTEQVMNNDEHKEQLIPVSTELQLQGGGVFYLIIERNRDGHRPRLGHLHSQPHQLQPSHYQSHRSF